MRAELLYNPGLLCERIAEISQARRRRRVLKETPAEELSGAYLDSLELLQLMRHAKPQVIYDIGAFVGTWTLLAKAIFPTAVIHSFEPIGELRERFLKTTSGLSQVTHHQVALGAARGPREMQIATFLDSSSMLPMAERQMALFGSRPAASAVVQVDRLDSYVRERGLPMPDLIKLDIQGFELEALRGAEECLRHATGVIAEVSFAEFYKGQCLFEEVVAFMSARSYRTQAFGAKTKTGERLLQADVLFEKISDGLSP